MFSLSWVLVAAAVGAVVAALWLHNRRSKRALKAQIKAMEIRKEVEDEVANLTDGERHAAGNKWVRPR